MNNVRTFKENLKKIFLHETSFVTKPKTYMNQFKKNYDHRTKSENILVECLYKLEFLSYDDRRFLGAMEGILLMEGYLSIGYNFKYDIKPIKFLFMKFEKKETYKEYMLKITKDFLRQRGVL